jgi:hypothetical protein
MKKYKLVHYEGYNADIISVIEEFETIDDDAANKYAEENYPNDSEWYILDENGENING